MIVGVVNAITPKWRIRIGFLIALLFYPMTASAHAPIKNISSFYNGVLHPIFVAEHLFLIIAVGLFFGQQNTFRHQKAIISFFVAVIAGLAISLMLKQSVINPLIFYVSTLLMGAVICLELKINQWFCIGIALYCGLLLGLDSVQETLVGSEKLVALMGCFVGIFLSSLLVMALTMQTLKSPRFWKSILIRVFGAWIIAINIIMLAFRLTS